MYKKSQPHENISDIFKRKNKDTPFLSHEEYTTYLFLIVDFKINNHLSKLEQLCLSSEFSTNSIMYPDFQFIRNHCDQRIAIFFEHTEFIGEEFQIDDLFDYVEQRAKVTANPLPIYEVAKNLKMNHFTFFCFICGMLSATQKEYSHIFRIINGDDNKLAPTFDGLSRLFFGEHYPIAQLYAKISKTMDTLGKIFDLNIFKDFPLSTYISPDKRLIDYLFGNNSSIENHETYGSFFSVLNNSTPTIPLIANQAVLEHLQISYDDGIRIFTLFGEEGCGKTFTLKHFCAANQLSCIMLDCQKIFSNEVDIVRNVFWTVARECMLTNACCCFTNLRPDIQEHFSRYLDLAIHTLTKRNLTIFTLSRDSLPLQEFTKLGITQLDIPTPNYMESQALWRFYANSHHLLDEIDFKEMATKFLFTPGNIKNALTLAKSLALMKKSTYISQSVLFEACNRQISHALAEKATKLKVVFTWDDIVIASDQRRTLQNACNQMKYRKMVLDDLDYKSKFPYGCGLSILLFGAPGTGKSMCAQVIANELKLELYRVDLSKILDKYIGETEKSIAMIFNEAKKTNVVLFFDECDTLFSKRVESNENNNAQNNNKVAMLLQEIESYSGISVLATNLKANIDPAFFRRMKFVVEFQRPDANTRYHLWTTSIPKQTCLAQDVDFKFLAEKCDFVGGNIKNCIYNAAFLAISEQENQQVHMKHYIQAVQYEYVKLGKIFNKTDFIPYSYLLD